MKIGISMGCFYYWKSGCSIPNQLKYIDLIEDLDIDAIELHITEEEILNNSWKKFIGKLGDHIITMHLPKALKRGALDKLNAISKKLNIQQFIIHADERAKMGRLPKNIKILVENSDQQKEGFQNLKDMKKFREDVCLDINHFEESFPNQLKDQIKYVKEKIKEIHISALNNKLYDYPHKTVSRHYLITGSDYKIPSFLPKDVIWMIEGVIPEGNLDLLEKEIKMLRKI